MFRVAALGQSAAWMLTVAMQMCAAWWLMASGDCCLQAACPQQQSAQQLPKANASLNSPGGYIDLMGVSSAYSGALKAATHRVEDASSDTALAKALAEKADLERQLKVRHCLQTRVLMHFVQDISMPDSAAAFSINLDMHFSKISVSKFKAAEQCYAICAMYGCYVL